MLEVLRELNITKLIDGKKYKNNEIFKKVHEEMVKLGVNTKSPDQIKNKWKALKTTYNNTKKKNSQSGSERATCEFFDELNEILGERPAYSIDGIDSQGQESQDFENDNDENVIPEVTPNSEPGVDVQIEVDQSLTKEDLRASVPQVTKEGLSNDEIRKEITDSRKRKYGESSKSKDELMFKYQREILKEFFANQKESEERAAKQRTSDLKLVLNTFTKTMENIMKSSMPPMMPYSYMPFGAPSSSTSKNLLVSPSSSNSQKMTSSTKAQKKLDTNYTNSDDSE